MQPYFVYGHFYDATQGAASSSQYLHLLRKHHPTAKSLLEIACGTGAQLLPLSKYYAVAGLDASGTMLRYARKKLPGVKFFHQDMAGFKVPQTFDAIICPYDSMNHLLKFDNWVRTFRAAKRHLNGKGVFVFDVNTDYKFRQLIDGPAAVHRFGGHYMIMKVVSAGGGVADFDVKIFEQRRKTSYHLHHEIIKERAFAHGRVLAALRRNFNKVRAYDVEGWSRPKKYSRRLFYVCQNDSYQGAGVRKRRKEPRVEKGGRAVAQQRDPTRVGPNRLVRGSGYGRVVGTGGTSNIQHPMKLPNPHLIGLRSRRRSEAMAGGPTSAKATAGRPKLRPDRS